MILRRKAFENIKGKGENAGNHFRQCFLTCQGQMLSLGLHLKCRLQILSIWTCVKFCHLIKSKQIIIFTVISIFLDYRPVYNWFFWQLIINSIPNDKILDWSKLKAIADDKIYVTEKICFEKGRKWWLPAFSPFLTLFSENFLYKVLKSHDCVVKN